MNPTRSLLALVPILATAACGKAPEPPGGAAPGEPTLYGGLQLDAEIYEPVIRQYAQAAQDYLDGGGEDCFTWPALNRGDSAAVALYDFDAAVLPGAAQAKLFPYSVSQFRSALVDPHWEEVFKSTIKEFTIVDEGDAAAFEAGTSHHFFRQYDAKIDVVGNELAYVSNNQIRTIDDWDGTGEPLMLLRGWLPAEETTSSNANVSASQLMKLELYVPVDGGTVRVVGSWSDMDIGVEGEDAMFTVACISLNKSMDDIEDWLEDHFPSSSQ